MVAGVSGMDVAGVRELAHRMQESAGRVQDMVARIDGQIARSSWEGRDAQQFRGAWWPAHRQQLLTAAEGLAGLGRSAADNADAQERTSASAGAGSDVSPGGPSGPVSAPGGWGVAESWRESHGSQFQRVFTALGPFGAVIGQVYATADAGAHRDLQIRADGRGLLFHQDAGAEASARVGGSVTHYVGPVVLQDSTEAAAKAAASSSSTVQVGRDGVVLADRHGAEASVAISETRSAQWGIASMSATSGGEASAQLFLDRGVHADRSGLGFNLGAAAEVSADAQQKNTFQLSGLTISQGIGYGVGEGGHAGVSGNVGPVTSFSANAGLWFMAGFSGEQTVSVDWDQIGDDITPIEPLTRAAHAQWDAAWDRVSR